MSLKFAIIVEEPLDYGEDRWLRAVMNGSMKDGIVIPVTSGDCDKNDNDTVWQSAVAKHGAEIPAGIPLLCLGKWAFRAAGGSKDNFSKWRAAVQEIDGRQVICYDSIRYCIRWQPWHEQNLINMLQRIVLAANGQLKLLEWPTELLYPGKEAFQALKTILYECQQGASLIGLDLETKRNGDITAVGLASNTRAVALPWERYYANGYGEVKGIGEYAYGKECRELIEAIIENEDLPKVLQNGIFDQGILVRAGITLRGFSRDTLLLDSRRNYRMPHDLGFMVASAFPVNPWKAEYKRDSDITSLDTYDPYADVPEEILRRYNARDTFSTVLLAEKLEHVYRESPEQYERLHHKAQMVMHMRQAGIPIDKDAVEKHRVDQQAKLEAVSQEIKAFIAKVGFVSKKGEFNPGSPHQVRALLYDFWKLPVNPRHRTKTGLAKTDDKAITELKAWDGQVKEFIELLIRYRRASKILGTYLAPFESVDRLAVVWRPNGTITGRLSATMDGGGPSIQTIPPALRNIVCAEPGCVLLKADYSALELRIAALVMGDDDLLEAFASGQDLHLLNAEAIYQKKGLDKDRDKAKRAVAKFFVYAVLYGAEAEGICERAATRGLSMSLDFTRLCRTNWFKAHPKMWEWMQSTHKQAQRDMFVTLPFSGNKIHFFGTQKDVKLTDTSNYPIQGTAAEIMDRAWKGVTDEIGWANKKRKVIIQNHDELVMQSDNVERDVELLKRHMVQTLSLNGRSMRFDIECSYGPNWKEQKEVK